MGAVPHLGLHNPSVFDNRWFRRLPSNKLFLTYDDGPNPPVTDRLLDVLNDFGATATFFITGESLRCDACTRSAKAIVNRGHALGNHGLIHSNVQCPRFHEMRQILRQQIGVDTRLIRAPFGSKYLLERYLRFVPDSRAFHWSAHFFDWLPHELQQKEEAFSSILLPGNILLLHDGYPERISFRDRSSVIGRTIRILRHCSDTGLKTDTLASVFPHLHVHT
jgi:peptidoglycan/xylan/chitin deacetylase (PgdA/CDA1 family)